jgi:hypothetical protein
MITSSLCGNCGNQQLSYIITRVVAETLGYDFGFNKIPSHDYYNGKQQLDFFDLNYGKEHNYGYGEIPNGIKYIWNEPKETIYRPDIGDSYNFHKYDEGLFNIPDNTKLIVESCQNALYYNHKKQDIKKWFQIKEEKIIEAEKEFDKNEICFDENLCILNIRGGAEYKSIPNLILRKKYWIDSMNYMNMINSNIKFIVITDDVPYAKELLGLPTYHFSISTDYYTITLAKNLILSNSSFAIMPSYLSDNAKNIIAPFGWARHNCSDGYFASTDMTTFKWKFMNKEGNLYEYL